MVCPVLTFTCRIRGITLTCDIVLEPVAVKTHSQEYSWITVDQLEICLDAVHRSKVMARQALTMFSQTWDPRITRIYLKCPLPMLLQGCLSIAIVITLPRRALYRSAGISHSSPSLLHPFNKRMVLSTHVNSCSRRIPKILLLSSFFLSVSVSGEQ